MRTRGPVRRAPPSHARRCRPGRVREHPATRAVRRSATRARSLHAGHRSRPHRADRDGCCAASAVRRRPHPTPLRTAGSRAEGAAAAPHHRRSRGVARHPVARIASWTSSTWGARYYSYSSRSIPCRDYSGPMAGTRELVVRAAIRILGTEGVRALTHARIDTVAQVPPGSCSNHFRTRRALLLGIAEQMASDELAAFARFSEQPPSRDELIELLTHIVELQTGAERVATLARHRLFLEVAEGEAAGAFDDGRSRFTAWT